MDKRFIDSCEKEALHLSAAIQPHGVLLVCCREGLLTACSENMGEWLDTSHFRLGATPPEPFLGWLQSLPEQPGSRLEFGTSSTARGQLDIALSRNAGGQAIIEITQNIAWDRIYSNTSQEIGTPINEAAIAERQNALVAKIADISEFPRVLYYRFREDGDGEVIAEKRQQGIYGSYLGLRFPASDIPQIARTLYRLNPWRFIPDAQARPVSLLFREGHEPPDLSYSDLRSVSPVHQLYLANMGVLSSLSFPIQIGQDLWGLIACHHPEPTMLSRRQLETIAQEVKQHSIALASYWAQRRIQLVDGLARRFSDIRTMIYASGNLFSAWPGNIGAWLAREFEADGATLQFGDETASWGLELGSGQLAAIDAWLQTRPLESIWMGECLSQQIPDFGLSEAAGLLAVKVRISEREFLRVYLTRQEYVHEIAWGGNPEKPVEYHDGEFGIAPRRSFERWVEKRLGSSRPWNNESRLLALKLRELLLEFAEHV